MLRVRFVFRESKSYPGHGSIYCRITLNQKRASHFSTGIKCRRKEWLPAKQKLKGTENTAKSQHLHEIEEGIRQTLFEMQRGGRHVTATSLKKAYLSPNESHRLIDMCYRHQKEKTKEVSVATAKNYNRYINKLSEFLEAERIPNITIQEVTPKLSHRYKFFLSEQGYNTNYISRCRKFISQVLDWCVNEEYVEYNRLIGVKYDNVKTKHVFLTESELQRLKSTTFDLPRLEKVRVLFLLQCYLGLSYKDFKEVTPKHFELENGRLWLKKYRSKVDGHAAIVPVFKEAREILEKCNYAPKVLSNTNYNVYLKEIATVTRIHKNLTTHVARKTYCMYLLNRGVNIKVVSRILGHSSVAVTERYYGYLLTSSVQKELEDKDLF